MAESDWISAMQRLMTGGLPQDTALTSDPGGPFGALYSRTERDKRGGVEALPLGDIADPISQIAMILAPILRNYAGGIAARPPISPMKRRFLGSERGSSESMDELQRLFEERHKTPVDPRDIVSGPRPEQPPLNLAGGNRFSKSFPEQEAQARSRAVESEIRSIDAGSGGFSESYAQRATPGSKEHLAVIYDRLKKQAARGKLSPQDAKMLTRLDEHFAAESGSPESMRLLRNRALQLDRRPPTAAEIPRLEKLRDSLFEHQSEASRGMAPALTVREKSLLKKLDDALYTYRYGPEPVTSEDLEPF